MLALLVVMNVGTVCVDRTDVCAPAGSTTQGSITQMGGEVTITPNGPMTALGAQFRAGGKLVVDVQPWSSSDGKRGAVVHVRGDLDGTRVISGARVSGNVRIGQMQGRPGAPQLEHATAFEASALDIPKVGKVEVGPGTKLEGNVDIGGLRYDVTSTQPIHALGLDFDPGTVRIETRQTGYVLGGMLARPQVVVGVRVEKQLYVTVENGTPKFGPATMVDTTPLAKLGLPDGEIPAGTAVRTDPTATLVFGSITVCGLALAPVPTQSQPAVTFMPSSSPKQVVVYAKLASANTKVGDVFMSGGVTLRYRPGSCELAGVEGTLSAPSEQHGLHFAAGKPFVLGDYIGGPIVRGTLARAATVDNLPLGGEAMVSVAKNGDVHLINGTLAKPARFEDWNVPAGTHVERWADGWAFTTAAGTSARAAVPHHGERVDDVTDARFDVNGTALTLARPHVLTGTPLAFSNMLIDHTNGCVTGGFARAQAFGMFRFPADGSATVCKGAIVDANGSYAVPSLQVGTWFATQAFAGARGSKPPDRSSPAVPSADPPTGYWIQINSLCQGRAGIPLPPPPEHWIWVDLKGVAASATDLTVLTQQAAKRGTACPVTPCCPP